MLVLLMILFWMIVIVWAWLLDHFISAAREQGGQLAMLALASPLLETTIALTVCMAGIAIAMRLSDILDELRGGKRKNAKDGINQPVNPPPARDRL